MPDMLLLADIGNTCVKIGLATPDAVEVSYTLPTRAQHTADSLGLSLVELLRHAGWTPADIRACLLCSVVPGLDTLFRQACIRFLGQTPLAFPADFSPDMENRYERPDEVGADRLLAAYAARRLYPEAASLISVDFGTATTFDCVSGNAYLGGLICPGVLSSHAALAVGTAQLPRISLEVRDDEPLVGRSTATSMRHGFVFGFAAMTEGLCRRLKAQLPCPTLVVGTGGFAADVARVCDALDHLRPDLILEGLRLAWTGRRP
ncbi:MAG: type III pantothenate kinase [Desulfovibrionaceae bacterium]|nr:type III pantothenate kinase [Desulfovibrionaceae bacterium]